MCNTIFHAEFKIRSLELFRALNNVRYKLRYCYLIYLIYLMLRVIYKLVWSTPCNKNFRTIKFAILFQLYFSKKSPQCSTVVKCKATAKLWKTRSSAKFPENFQKLDARKRYPWYFKLRLCREMKQKVINHRKQRTLYFTFRKKIYKLD